MDWLRFGRLERRGSRRSHELGILRCSASISHSEFQHPRGDRVISHRCFRLLEREEFCTFLHMATGMSAATIAMVSPW